MIISKFDVGNEVIVVDSRIKKKRLKVECDICNSTGKVKIKNKTFYCPECNNKLQREQACGMEYFVVPEYHMIYGVAEEKWYTSETVVEDVTYHVGELESSLIDLRHIKEWQMFATRKEAVGFCKDYKPDPDTGMPIPKIKKRSKRG